MGGVCNFEGRGANNVVDALTETVAQAWLEEIADEELLDKTLTPIEIAVELEIAEKTALCLWHIGCLLTHSGSKGGDETRGKFITPLDNFDMFSEKLLQL